MKDNGRPAYVVSGIVPHQYENEIAGGDSESLEEYTSKQAAFRKAKAESKKPKWYEVEVRLYDERDEIRGCWYFKEGKLTWDRGI